MARSGLGGDLTDIASTVAERDGLPEASAKATAAVAGAPALLTAAVAAALERAGDKPAALPHQS